MVLISTKYRKNPSLLKRLLVPGVTVCITMYFGWHAWHGEFGIKAWMRHEDEIKILRTRLEELQGDVRLLREGIDLLRADSLGSDILAERARNVLWFVHEDDVVIYDPGCQNLDEKD